MFVGERYIIKALRTIAMIGADASLHHTGRSSSSQNAGNASKWSTELTFLQARADTLAGRYDAGKRPVRGMSDYIDVTQQ